MSCQCLLSGEKRTWRGRDAMSGNDPKLINASLLCRDAKLRCLLRSSPRPEGYGMRGREFITLVGGPAVAWPHATRFAEIPVEFVDPFRMIQRARQYIARNDSPSAASFAILFDVINPYAFRQSP